MIYNQKSKELPKSLENFARGMLATTCLTVACGATAMGGTITEGTSPAPSPFPTTPNGYLLPLGTTQVSGQVIGGEGANNPAYFEFQGLVGGASYTLSGESPDYGNFKGLVVYMYHDGMGVGNTSDNIGVLDFGEGDAPPQVFTAPADGNLVVEAKDFQETGLQTYTVSLNQNETGPVEGGSTVPEPSTLAGVGLGLGALSLAWRRRRVQ